MIKPNKNKRGEGGRKKIGGSLKTSMPGTDGGGGTQHHLRSTMLTRGGVNSLRGKKMRKQQEGNKIRRVGAK